MIKNKIGIHLHAKDIVKTKEFFVKLGFYAALDSKQTLCSFSLDTFEPNIRIIFHDTASLKKHTSCQDIYENNQNHQVFLSIEANSKAELYELANKVKNAGGNLCFEPSGFDDELMSFYHFEFTDLNGYSWDVVYEK